MEPQIRYVRSADGTKIATASLGAGEPVGLSPPTLGFIDAYFAVPEARNAMEHLAERHRVVTYDPRGRGLSDSAVTDWSLQARVDDLLAVFDGTSITSACVLGRAYGSPVTIAFAAMHPERVRRLGLYAGVARGADISAPASTQVNSMVMDGHISWAVGCQFIALLTLGWSESAKTFADLMEKAFTPESFRDYREAALADDVSDRLEIVRCPALLIQPSVAATPQGTVLFSRDAWREVAMRIPDARVRTSDLVAWTSFWLSDDDAKAFVDFFDEDEPHANGAPLPSGTAIILFADIVDSTALTERLGDAAFRDGARALDGLLRTIIVESGGTPIDGKLLGDGVLATFPAASQGIAAALACGSAGEDRGLPLHLGLHAGDVIREENNVFGGAVNIASRISALSAPGEVLVSRTVADLARTSAGVAFADRGEHALKGVADPQRVYAVRRAE
jgi:class 3 adenylate cyclase